MSASLRLTPVVILRALLVSLAACGGSTSADSTVPPDSGHGDARPRDGSADSPSAKPDASCVAAPVAGGTCTPGVSACASGGPCATLWFCDQGSWSAATPRCAVEDARVPECATPTAGAVCTPGVPLCTPNPACGTQWTCASSGDAGSTWESVTSNCVVEDAARSAPDGGEPSDAGAQTDGSARSDGGKRSDGGALRDGGGHRDGSARPDAGSHVDARPDVQTSGHPDGGVSVTSCAACGASELCVTDIRSGGACYPSDGGGCDNGATGACCNTFTSYTCESFPESCASGVSCACAAQLCTGIPGCDDAGTGGSVLLCQAQYP